MLSMCRAKESLILKRVDPDANCPLMRQIRREVDRISVFDRQNVACQDCFQSRFWRFLSNYSSGCLACVKRIRSYSVFEKISSEDCMYLLVFCPWQLSQSSTCQLVEEAGLWTKFQKREDVVKRGGRRLREYANVASRHGWEEWKDESLGEDGTMEHLYGLFSINPVFQREREEAVKTNIRRISESPNLTPGGIDIKTWGRLARKWVASKAVRCRMENGRKGGWKKQHEGENATTLYNLPILASEIPYGWRPVYSRTSQPSPIAPFPSQRNNCNAASHALQ